MAGIGVIEGMIVTCRVGVVEVSEPGLETRPAEYDLFTGRVGGGGGVINPTFHTR
jgi:hypothetical protein